MGSCYENPEEPPLLAAPHFYWACCMICRKIGTPEEPLKRCSRCNCMYYCSADHQKRHWKKHKPLCVYLSSAAEEVGSNYFFSTWEDENGDEEDEQSKDEAIAKWRKFRVNAVQSTEVLMGKKLDEWEKEVFLFPRVCRLCRKGRATGMEDCATCMSVSYCGKQCKEKDAEHHQQWCSELKFAMASDNFETTISIAAPALPNALDSSYQPVPDQIEDYLNGAAGRPTTDISEMEWRFLSDRLSGPLTILHVAQRFGLANGKEVKDSTELTIHIVGANVVEMLGIIKWEFVMHKLPNCQVLRLVFVGPEQENEGVDAEYEGIGKCLECSQKKKLIYHDIKCKLYHEYVASKDYVPADLVVAFNCGFHEFQDQNELDTWKHSLPVLLQTEDVPLVLTSYNKCEADKDLNCIQSASDRLKVQVAAQRNPFRSWRPIRDFEFNDNCDVFYNNNFYSVVRKLTTLKPQQ